MPKVFLRHPHALKPAHARQLLQVLMDRFAARYRFKCRWVEEHKATVRRMGVKGWVFVDENEVLFDLDLAFFLAPFCARIQQGIANEVQHSFDEAQLNRANSAS